MKIAICDTDIFSTESLKNELISYSAREKILMDLHTYTNNFDRILSDSGFDMLFLEFLPKKLNESYIINKIRMKSKNVKIVFLSKDLSDVCDSLKYEPYRFLLKPLDRSKLHEALISAVNKNSKSIVVRDPVNKKNIVVDEDDIFYVQADNVYSLVSTVNGTYRYVKRISALENELSSEYFFRSNRSYIVNFKYVSSYDRESINLINGHKALISKNKYDDFEKKLKAFLCSHSVTGDN